MTERDTRDITKDNLSSTPEESTGAGGVDSAAGNPEGEKSPRGKKRRRLPAGLRIPLKILGWVIIVVLLIPVVIYLPPVQSLLKDVAGDVVKKSTGMDVEIGAFRLKFPLDVLLKDVSVVEATGDTMVRAREVIADVKLLPLLNLDVKVKKLSLLDGYYRMVSPDSSMIMKIKAGKLEVDPKSSVSIAKSEILLSKAYLADGDVELYMNVWKQKPTPLDTTSTPFYIRADQLDIERMRFAMSMLPTIDTMMVEADNLKLRQGIINLRTNEISMRSVKLAGGAFTYLTPTPEYIKTHPAPATDTMSVASPPMIIRADSIDVSGLKALYAMKGAKPLPGFDPSYIEVSDVSASLRGFFNRQTDLRLPIEALSGRERCGLQIADCSGLVALTEAGIELDGMRVKTPYSEIAATADVPFALMELKPEAPVEVDIEASVGMADIVSFMPALNEYIKALPRSPLNAVVKASGRLSDVEIPKLNMAMPDFFSVRASGHARNALDFKKLVAALQIEGEVSNPAPIKKLAGGLPVDLPPLKLKGRAGANMQNYTADLQLTTPQGSLLADGKVGLTSETYFADLDVSGVNVGHFMPDLGIGKVSAVMRAEGRGFNPTNPRARSDISMRIKQIDYKGKALSDITLKGTLAESAFSLNFDSPNRDLNLTADLVGTLAPDNYCVQGFLKVYRADLQAFGLTPDENYGSADLELDVAAQPGKWLYDASLEFASIDWHMPDLDIFIPDGINVYFTSEADNVHGRVEARGTDIAFDAYEGLERVVDGFSKTATSAMEQMSHRNLDVETLQAMLPQFRLKARAAGKGLISDFLPKNGMGVDSLAMNLSNDSLLNGDIYALGLNTGGMTLDTITFNLKERGALLDYKLHMGNRPGSLDEFAQVNLNGYAGSNRLSAFLTQKNLQGKTGYRFGFTAAVADSTLSVHFTPMKATIAYMPWTFNEDNHIDYEFYSRRTDANLYASSRESSILLKTMPSPLGEDDLHLKLTNIHVQDFLNMSLSAPPVKADVDADISVNYDGKRLNGQGEVNVRDFIYDKMMVGNFDLNLLAGVNLNGESDIKADLKVNGDPAVSLLTTLEQRGEALEPKNIDVELTRFPLKVANAFLGADVAKLSGVLNGKMNMTGSFMKPVLNGAIACDKVDVYLPMMGSSLKLSGDSLSVADNVVKFDRFDIYGQNSNPLTINGDVDAREFNDIKFDLTANASDFQLINNDRRAKSDIYGKLFLNLTAGVKGPMSHFDVNANLTVLGNSDVYYTIPMTASSKLQTMGSSDGLVKFVNFNDTTQVERQDTVGSMMAMRVTAGVTITPGTQVTVNLSDNGTDKVQLSPSGTLNYFQNFMGDMSLNGQLYLGNGFARYNVPVMGQKTFTFDPQSNVLFNGDVMNPVLNIKATDTMKATVVNSSGNSNLVNFLVGLDISGSLSAPKVVFDLSTNDDLSLQNELQSMSADQRSTQAMNLLITGRYQGSGMKTTTGPMAQNMLYSFLTSQINSWAAKNIRGVDLSFGVDQYDKTLNGQNSSAMSYSYQVSKSLFNNRFKIVVGGNYSTDASADENLSQNLISDISFEYTLKQTNNLTMLVRLFRHTGFESILEGEVTETGVGFTMRRRLSTLRNIFKVRWGKRKPKPEPADTGTPVADPVILELREQRKEEAEERNRNGVGNAAPEGKVTLPAENTISKKGGEI